MSSLADEPVISVCLAEYRHRDYVQTGGETRLPADQRPSLGILLIVVDSEGWATLHRVVAIFYNGDRGGRGVRFGPRIPWPDGRIAARHLGEAAPEVEVVRQAELLTWSAAR